MFRSSLFSSGRNGGCCDKALLCRPAQRQTAGVLIFGFCFYCRHCVMLRTPWQIIWVRLARWSSDRNRTNTLNNVMICLIMRQRRDLTHSAIWLLWHAISYGGMTSPLIETWPPGCQTWLCIWLDFNVKLISDFFNPFLWKVIFLNLKYKFDFLDGYVYIFVQF